MINIGKLNSIITVETVDQVTDNGLGGTQITYNPAKEVWANVRTLRQNEFESYGVQVGMKAYMIGIRYDLDDPITESAKITYNGKKFNIMPFEDVREENDYIKFVAYVSINRN